MGGSTVGVWSVCKWVYYFAANRKFEIVTRDQLIIVLIENGQIDCSPVVAR